MRHYLALLFFGLIACGGGSSSSDESALANTDSGINAPDGELGASSLQELFESCLASDAADFAVLLETMEGFLDAGFLDQESEIPIPQFDLLGGLLSGGKIPYTWDLDGDGTNELKGELRFLDENGNTTIPFDIPSLILNGISEPADLLGEITDGSRIEIGYKLGGLLLTGAQEGSGEGALIFGMSGGAPTSVSGEGSFSAGSCLFDFSLDEVALDITNLDGLPEVAFDFDATIGEDTVAGTIDFDGTSTAKVSAKLNDEPIEEFEFDIDAP